MVAGELGTPVLQVVPILPRGERGHAQAVAKAQVAQEGRDHRHVVEGVPEHWEPADPVALAGQAGPDEVGGQRLDEVVGCSDRREAAIALPTTRRSPSVADDAGL